MDDTLINMNYKIDPLAICISLTMFIFVGIGIYENAPLWFLCTIFILGIYPIVKSYLTRKE